MSSTIVVTVPDIGSLTDVPVIEIPVAVVDEVELYDALMVVESDKATLDIPSNGSGTTTTQNKLT